MMPNLDGQAVLRGLRGAEEQLGLTVGEGAKVVMTTCLKDSQNMMTAFREQRGSSRLQVELPRHEGAIEAMLNSLQRKQGYS
jgi:hypothetical protein